MHIAFIGLLLFWPTVFGITCDSWAAKVARQWRSIFVPDNDFADPKPTLPENNEMGVREYPGDALFLNDIVPNIPPSVPHKFLRPTLNDKGANSSPVDSTVDRTQALRNGLNNWKTQEPLSRFVEELVDFLIEMRVNNKVPEAATDKLLKAFLDPSSRHAVPSQRKVAISIDL